MSRPQELLNRIVRGGPAQIELMIADAETEDLFMDYKRSADDGGGRSLHNSDRTNLARAISGFGNSEGGIIVWGVDCRNDPDRGDVPVGARHIQNPVRFKSWLDQITTGLTVPAHDGVVHNVIASSGEVQGFVVSFIPQGVHAPYQTVRDSRYLMRAGSNFVPVPHGVLAGLFGRRPQPNVFAMFVAEQNFEYGSEVFRYRFGIGLCNKGPGIAEDSYLNVNILDTGGRNSVIEVEQEPAAMWSNSNFARRLWNSTMMRDFRLAPEAVVTPIILTIRMCPPFEGAFRVKLSSGANGAVPYKGELNVPATELQEHYNAVIRSSQGRFREACRAFGDRLLRI